MKFPDQKCYEDVPLNDISVTRGWVVSGCTISRKKTSRGCTLLALGGGSPWMRVKFPDEKPYVTLESPLMLESED